MNKAVFLDKDGTLVKNIPYSIIPEKIMFYPEVPEALKLLKRNGFKIVIISNQPGVAYGYFEEEDLKKVKETLQKMLEVYAIKIDGFYYCPHHTEGKVKTYTMNCSCRKPKPGMIIQAANELKIDISKSWMIGDILNDIEAGNSAGCKTILIDNGNETEWILNALRNPTYTVKKVWDAAIKVIMENEKVRLDRGRRFL